MTNGVGKCVSVLYDEGGAELVAYRGVVVYVERARYALDDCTAPSRPSPPPQPTAMPLPPPCEIRLRQCHLLPRPCPPLAHAGARPWLSQDVCRLRRV